MTWTEKDDTHTAKAGVYMLTVWRRGQGQSFGWTVTRGYIVKTGDADNLEVAKKAAEAAMSLLSKD